MGQEQRPESRSRFPGSIESWRLWPGMIGCVDCESQSVLTVEYLPIVLVIFAVMGPAEAGAQAEVCQLDVAVSIWEREGEGGLAG